MVRGSCLCGAVTWQSEGPFELMTHCHCTRCRKAHGSAFGTYAGTPAEGFRYLSGEDAIVRFESSPGTFRSFCGRCGSVTPGATAFQGRVFVPVGCLDDDPGARPLAHLFAASRAPWYEITDDLPRFDAWPPGYELPEVPAPKPPEPLADALRGSCLCSAVAFVIEGAPTDLRHCHCARCRKARGAAFASNLFVPADRVRYLRGEEQLRSFKVPEAQRFTHVFCGSCGASLPRLYPERGVGVVPAGVLDDDPGVRASSHIFVASKAPWLEIRDGLPQHAEYPPA